jgi:GNAT superfamily N-acetyltransferase
MTRLVTIAEAGPEDLDEIAPLFDAYRVFYEQGSDPERARLFLDERLTRGESVIFLARRSGAGVGFVQMYPSFSSVWTNRVWILNDLFVDASARRSGVAEALLEHAADWARKQGALGLVLETADDNEPASALYEKLGWVLQTEYKNYQLELG